MKVTNRSLDELLKSIHELEHLTTKQVLNGQEQRRHSFLLAKISLLKQGVNPIELRHWETDRLLSEAGLKSTERATTKLPSEVEAEWRDFVQGRPTPQHLTPPEAELRAQQLAGSQSITYTEQIPGGAFVPTQFYSRSLEIMKQYDRVFDPEFHNHIETDSGSLLPIPIFDDTSNDSVFLGETVQGTQVAVANFARAQLAAYTSRSQIVAVSVELLQDSAFPWGAILERIFAMRHSRGVGKKLMRGSGVNEPTGLLTGVVASGVSPVIATGAAANDGGSETSSNSIGTQDINNLIHQLDPAYRPGSVFYMNDNTLASLEGLLNKFGQPIVTFGKGLYDDDDNCPYLFRKRVCISPSMPDIGPASNPIVYGNPFYFAVRTVPSASYVRAYREAPVLVESGLVGFESWMRVDSNVVSTGATRTPFQYLQQHS